MDMNVQAKNHKITSIFWKSYLKKQINGGSKLFTPKSTQKKLGEIPNWQVKIKGCKQQQEEPNNNAKEIEYYYKKSSKNRRGTKQHNKRN
jgi:hypothetical protein